MTSDSPRSLTAVPKLGGAMFEPRLSPKTLCNPRPRGGDCTVPHAPERLGELHDPRDRAGFAEFGHACIAPTDQDTGRKLGQFPFTP